MVMFFYDFGEVWMLYWVLRTLFNVRRLEARMGFEASLWCFYCWISLKSTGF